MDPIRTYMKNKIGILENDIYIFPIVNSVICEVYNFLTVCTFAQFGMFFFIRPFDHPDIGYWNAGDFRNFRVLAL